MSYYKYNNIKRKDEVVMKEKLKEIRTYGSELITDESGMEFLEVAIVIALGVGLIGVLAFIFTMIGNKMSDSGEAVQNMDTNSNQQTNPWNSNNGGGESGGGETP